MKKNINPDRTKFCVILDANILRKGIPISKDVESLIYDYLKEPRIKIKCYVPEVARLEFEKYCKDTLDEQVRKHNSATDIINKLSGGENNILSTDDSRKLLADIAHKYRLNTLHTPYKKIDISKLISSAVDRTPPFEEKGEKGFKDTVIAVTILETLANWAKVKVKRRVAFITDDENLRNYMGESASKYDNFAVYDSIPSFASELKLYLNQLDDHLINELSNKAKALFYQEDNPNCLYAKENIQGRILKEFNVVIANPSLTYQYSLPFIGIGNGGGGETIAKSWDRLGKSRFELSDPVFTHKNADIYTWESTVQYRQTYRQKENDYWSSTLGLAPLYEDKDYVVEFKITWQFRVETGVIIKEPKVIDIEQTVSRTEDASLITTYLPRIKSGATIAGQGTITVQDLE